MLTLVLEVLLPPVASLLLKRLRGSHQRIASEAATFAGLKRRIPLRAVVGRASDGDVCRVVTVCTVKAHFAVIARLDAERCHLASLVDWRAAHVVNVIHEGAAVKSFRITPLI